MGDKDIKKMKDKDRRENFEAAADRYDSMIYRRCGRSGLKLPLISLGLWHNFGGVDDPKEFRKILFTAFDKGITHFDLANNYGPPSGSAEENLGKILKHDLRSYRDELIISTKAGYLMWPGPYGEWGSRKYLTASLDQSLKRLHLDYVDIFYSHRPDPETPLEETMGALASAVKQGKALYAGISNYPADLTEKAAGLLRSMGAPALIHQPKYNMFDRWIEGELLDVLEKEGLGCIPFSPLAQGLLTDRYLNGIPRNSRADKEHGFLSRSAVTEENMRKANALNDLASGRGQTLSAMVLAWTLRDPRVTSALIGASSTEQLVSNLKALDHLSFSGDELRTIDGILS